MMKKLKFGILYYKKKEPFGIKTIMYELKKEKGIADKNMILDVLDELYDTKKITYERVLYKDNVHQGEWVFKVK